MKNSKKLQKEEREYKKLRFKFLSDKSVCHAKIHECSLRATEIHHKKGRGKYLLDITTWLPVCRNCHNWIENNPEDSYELGLSQKRNYGD